MHKCSSYYQSRPPNWEPPNLIPCQMFQLNLYSVRVLLVPQYTVSPQTHYTRAACPPRHMTLEYNVHGTPVGHVPRIAIRMLTNELP